MWQAEMPKGPLPTVVGNGPVLLTPYLPSAQRRRLAESFHLSNLLGNECVAGVVRSVRAVEFVKEQAEQ